MIWCKLGGLSAPRYSFDWRSGNMNIYVGNLSYQTSEEDMQRAFEAFGKVSSVAIIKDKFSGKSRGFVFVERESDEEAKAAIGAMDGRELRGRQLKVNEARPREERKPMARSGGGGGGRDRDSRSGSG